MNIQEANRFWAEARERVLKRARLLGVPVTLKEHDDEFLFDLYDNGNTIPTDQKVEESIKELLRDALSCAFPCYGCKFEGNETPRCTSYEQCGLWINWAKKAGVIPEVKPQAPDQADDASAQPTAVTAEDILKLIRFHNLTVDTFERVGKAVKVDGWLFGGMEMWHRIACEGAEIVGMARRLGIDATINMQKGEIILK